jgi:RNA polymerase sigma-70 factor, ECF subfamily
MMEEFSADRTSEDEKLAEPLVEKAIQRDKDAYASLFDIHFDRIFRYIQHRVCNKSDSEDIAQEVFIKGWKAISKYKITGAPFITWLFAIANNLICDYFRSQKNKSVPLDENTTSGDEQADPLEIANDNLKNNNVRLAIWNLKEEKQKVILLRFLGGYSCREIARFLKKSEGAIRVIQLRALADLRKMLKKVHETEENE